MHDLLTPWKTILVPLSCCKWCLEPVLFPIFVLFLFLPSFFLPVLVREIIRLQTVFCICFFLSFLFLFLSSSSSFFYFFYFILLLLLLPPPPLPTPLVFQIFVSGGSLDCRLFRTGSFCSVCIRGHYIVKLCSKPKKVRKNACLL